MIPEITEVLGEIAARAKSKHEEHLFDQRISEALDRIERGEISPNSLDQPGVDMPNPYGVFTAPDFEAYVSRVEEGERKKQEVEKGLTGNNLEGNIKI
jgi:hypothetical protein